MEQYRVTASLLNVRSEPTYVHDNKISVLHSGEIVNVQDMRDGWACIGPNQWVVSKYLSRLTLFEQYYANQGKKFCNF